jgi:hypothetical protein
MWHVLGNGGFHAAGDNVFQFQIPQVFVDI